MKTVYILVGLFAMLSLLKAVLPATPKITHENVDVIFKPYSGYKPSNELINKIHISSF